MGREYFSSLWVIALFICYQVSKRRKTEFAPCIRKQHGTLLDLSKKAEILQQWDLTLGDKVAVVNIVFSASMRETQRKNGTYSHYFTIDCIAIGHRLPVIEIWETLISNNSINLFLSFLLNFGMQCHIVEKSFYGRASLFTISHQPEILQEENTDSVRPS